MKFNLIFYNPSSLVDARLIDHELTKISEKNVSKAVNSAHYTIEEADANIFFDSINFSHLKKAPFNVFIPNFNLMSKEEVEMLPFFDLILVKTKYALDVLKSYVDESKLRYVGWRSNDIANLNIDKNFSECILTYSNDFVDCQKVIDNWESDFPNLNIVLNRKKIKLDKMGKTNVIFHDNLNAKEYEKLFNKCGISLCLEERAEYFHDVERSALSRSIVVTLDKGPSNEIFKDNDGDVFSVFAKKKKLENGLGSRFVFDGESLKNQIRQIMSLDRSTLKNIAIRNYGQIRRNSRAFEDNFKKLCREVVLANKDIEVKKIDNKVFTNDELPNISLVTLTYNRRQMFRMSTYNYNVIDYPIEKIEWIIVDDSDENETVDVHLPPKDKRDQLKIKYIRLENKTEIGAKRNIAVDAASSDIIIMFDDDDYYYPSSIKNRVTTLLNNKEIDCVACTTIGNFDINNFVSSMNLPPFALKFGSRISPATLCFYKSFWEERKFLEVDIDEAKDFFDNRLDRVFEISWENIIVGLVHSKNILLSPVAGQKPNGCHFKFSKKLYQFIITLDKHNDLKDDKNLDSIRQLAEASDSNFKPEEEPNNNEE